MTLRTATLGLLAQEEGSGYDLLQRFDQELSHVWNATQSQLYTELNRMAKQGIVEVIEKGARGRKVYAITEAGQAELMEWLAAPEQASDKNEWMLKVSLMGELSADRVAAHLRQAWQNAHRAKEELQVACDSTDWEDPSVDPFGRLAYEYGIRTQQSTIEWCEWALDYLGLGGRSDVA